MFCSSLELAWPADHRPTRPTTSQPVYLGLAWLQPKQLSAHLFYTETAADSQYIQNTDIRGALFQAFIATADNDRGRARAMLPERKTHRSEGKENEREMKVTARAGAELDERCTTVRNGAGLK